MRDIDGRYWNTLRNQTSETENAICELFDNSADAGATVVNIAFKGGEKSGKFIISDNGHGIKDIGKMFVFGSSDEKTNSSSGRYGTGSKPSIAYFGTVIEVTSIHEGVKRHMRWDTNVDVKTREWKNGMFMSPDVRTNEPSGTVIQVTHPHTHRVASSGIADRLSQHLSPALETGLIVTYNGQDLKPFDFEWEGEPVIKHGDINGHRYELTAGRAKGIPKSSCGLHIEKCHRSLPHYLNSREGLSSDLSILVRVRLLQTDHGKNEWPLDPTSKAFLADHGQWVALKDVIKESVESDVKDNQDKEKNLMLDGVFSRLEDTLNGRSRRSRRGDHTVVDGTGTTVEVDPVSRKGNGGGRTAPTKEAEAGIGDSHEASRSKSSGFRVIRSSSNPDDLLYRWRREGEVVKLFLFTDKFNNSSSEAPRVAATLVAHMLWFISKDYEDESILGCIPGLSSDLDPNVWVSGASKFLRGKV